MNAEVIQFVRPVPKKVVDKCSFCGHDLVKGEHIQSEPTAPAICFKCVGTCTTLLNEEKKQ